MNTFMDLLDYYLSLNKDLDDHNFHYEYREEIYHKMQDVRKELDEYIEKAIKYELNPNGDLK